MTHICRAKTNYLHDKVLWYAVVMITSSLSSRGHFLAIRILTSKMSSSCLAAVLQLTCTSDKLRNRAICRRLIETAKGRGASVAFLPEGLDFIGESSHQTRSLCEPLKGGETLNFYRQLASDQGIALSLGGLHERLEGHDDLLGNTHVYIDSNGNIQSVYRKTHLFDVEIPDRGVHLKESDYVKAGDAIKAPVALPDCTLKLGLAICYDLRFPELSEALRRKGAHVLTFPSAFTVATGAAGHWFTLLKARAIETQCYVVAAAQTGRHNSKRSSFGHACIIDPYGAVVAQCSEGEGLAMAELSAIKVLDVRQNMPIIKHKRHDLYGLCFGGEVEVSNGEGHLQFGHVQIPEQAVVLKARRSFVTVNRKPVVAGHLLVIPNRPAERLADLGPDEVQDLFMAVQQAQRLTESFNDANSSTVSIQDGQEAGQTVKHLHVHVLPRKKGDFEHNDQVYKELDQHDKGDNVKWREYEDMFAEAKMMRQHFIELTSN